MKSIEEIKQRKLDLYDSREKMQQLIDESNETDEIIVSAQNMVITMYNALIYQLDWILNEKN